MKTEFTKGPLQVSDTFGFGVSISKQGAKEVYLGNADSAEVNKTEAKANAQLWASAPELYEALEAVLHDLVSIYQSEMATRSDPSPENNLESVKQARAALQKARGVELKMLSNI